MLGDADAVLGDGERERVAAARNPGSASAAAASRRSGSLSSCAVISRPCRSKNDAPSPSSASSWAPAPSVAMRSIGAVVAVERAAERARARAHHSSSSRVVAAGPEREQPAVVQPPPAQVGLVGPAPVGRAAPAWCGGARARRARTRGARGRRAARRPASRHRGRAAPRRARTASMWRSSRGLHASRSSVAVEHRRERADVVDPDVLRAQQLERLGRAAVLGASRRARAP